MVPAMVFHSVACCVAILSTVGSMWSNMGGIPSPQSVLGVALCVGRHSAAWCELQHIKRQMLAISRRRHRINVRELAAFPVWLALVVYMPQSSPAKLQGEAGKRCGEESTLTTNLSILYW